MSAPLDAPAWKLAAEIAAGRLAASDLMAAVLARIAAVNGRLNAIVALRPGAELMAEARAADAAVARGPLHGLPVAVKDLVAVEGIVTSRGSPVFAGEVAARDDLLAARLRAAGAIPIGKTNVPEFGLGSHSYNPVYGVTRNPFDPSRSAGGSSGGAAAAVAAGMLPLADGSDMMGSLRNPAGWNNLYSLRPSIGLVPGEPLGDLFLHPLATDGPIGRCPRDLALLLSAMAGPDPRQPFTRPVADWAAAVTRADVADLAGRRIGWLGGWGGAWRCEDGVLERCEGALRVFGKFGAVVEPVAPPFSAAALWQSWVALRSFAVADRLAPVWENARTRAMLKPEAVWEIERGRRLSGREVQAASRIRSDWFRVAARAFERYDALALPSAQIWPFPAEWDWPKEIGGVTMDTYHRWMEVVVPVSLAGLPCVTLPTGLGEARGGQGAGLPMGVQLFGPMGSDAGLLGMAEAYHRATGWPSRCAGGLRLETAEGRG